MALIKCPKCGKDVSTLAAACPHCGCPFTASTQPSTPKPASPTSPPIQQQLPKPKPSGPVAKGCAGCLGVIVLLIIIGAFIGDDKKEPTDSERAAQVREKLEAQLKQQYKESSDAYAKAVAQVPEKIANSQVALKILTLTRENAYATGVGDGAADFQSMKEKTDAKTLAQWRDFKNSSFELMEAVQNKFDPVVFREYKRGWNDGYHP